MPFERIVRPFQTRVNTPPVRLQNPKTVDPQPFVLTIGGNGSGKTLSGSYSVSESVYMTQAAVERTTGTPPFNNSGGNSSNGGSFEGGI